MREASCGGVRACLARVDERGKESAQQARAAVTTLTHKSATGNTPPLASPETVQYCLQQYRDQVFLEVKKVSVGSSWAVAQHFGSLRKKCRDDKYVLKCLCRPRAQRFDLDVSYFDGDLRQFQALLDFVQRSQPFVEHS